MPRWRRPRSTIGCRLIHVKRCRADDAGPEAKTFVSERHAPRMIVMPDAGIPIEHAREHTARRKPGIRRSDLPDLGAFSARGLHRPEASGWNPAGSVCKRP